MAVRFTKHAQSYAGNIIARRLLKKHWRSN